MRARDLALYLAGHAAAIRRLAADPWAPAIGAILVLTAGIAREYDHVDLLAEPAVLLDGFVPPLIVAGLVWMFLPAADPAAGRPGMRLPFVTVLTLVFLTAPAAWLYAIPIEQLTDPMTAMATNLALL